MIIIRFMKSLMSSFSSTFGTIEQNLPQPNFSHREIFFDFYLTYEKVKVLVPPNLVMGQAQPLALWALALGGKRP